jgi:hydrogenase maturation protease
LFLLIGYGNPGRGDDGLGPALARRIGCQALPGVDVRIAFQLTVEHAIDVAQVDAVVFVDAHVAGQEPYSFSEVSTRVPCHLDSHVVSPEAVMFLAKHLFGSTARGYTLAIAGCEFGAMRDGLGEQARENLGRAEAFLTKWLGEQTCA